MGGFGFVVPIGERRRILAASMASAKFPGRAPPGKLLARVFLGGALQPEILAASDAELCRVAAEELAELLAIRGSPEWSELVRWPGAMPLYHLGHLERVGRIERAVARSPGLALAGNAYHGVGVPQCIASGQRAAAAVAQHLRSVPAT
jgi:oxygen-dependent protoporphyrinogen oxidase